VRRQPFSFIRVGGPVFPRWSRGYIDRVYTSGLLTRSGPDGVKDPKGKKAAYHETQGAGEGIYDSMGMTDAYRKDGWTAAEISFADAVLPERQRYCAVHRLSIASVIPGVVDPLPSALGCS